MSNGYGSGYLAALPSFHIRLSMQNCGRRIKFYPILRACSLLLGVHPINSVTVLLLRRFLAGPWGLGSVGFLQRLPSCLIVCVVVGAWPLCFRFLARVIKWNYGASSRPR
ncbi:unnamed protein product [Amoebophrya sp. A25]|nr:unnamed protein product [Amoebophrya sp. A25]|eukprot:GSA25T00019663001.1